MTKAYDYFSKKTHNFCTILVTNKGAFYYASIIYFDRTQTDHFFSVKHFVSEKSEVDVKKEAEGWVKKELCEDYEINSEREYKL